MSQFIFPPLTASLDSEQTNGGSLPAKQMVIAGYDSTATRALLTDSSGRLEINAVVSLPLPSGAATAALQTAGNNLLTTIDADTSSLAGAISGTEMQVDVVASLPAGSNNIGDVDVLSIVPGVGATNLGKAIQSPQGTTDTGVPALVVRNDTLADLSGADGDYAPIQVNATGAVYTAVHSSALPTGAATSALQTSSEALLTTIDADTSTLAGAVSGTEMQVDVITSALPSGAATEAKQDVIETTLNSIEGDTSSLAGAVSGTEMQVDVVAALPAGTNTIGKVDVNAIAPVDFLDAGVLDASTSNILSSGGTIVVSTELAAACTEIEVVDDIGEYMSIAHGTTKKAYLPLGGGRVKVSLATGAPIRLYSETGTNITSGKIAINFLG